jgi:hypothetical protein
MFLLAIIPFHQQLCILSRQSLFIIVTKNLCMYYYFTKTDTVFASRVDAIQCTVHCTVHYTVFVPVAQLISYS